MKLMLTMGHLSEHFRSDGISRNLSANSNVLVFLFSYCSWSVKLNYETDAYYGALSEHFRSDGISRKFKCKQQRACLSVQLAYWFHFHNVFL